MRPGAGSVKTRLRELDFLRGIAIILVLLRHVAVTPFTANIGWIGVDLFFVLSGFLVSGLLFREYLKFGNIRPWLFLVRRGFKIYPLYFLFYLVYLIPILQRDQFNIYGFLSDMTFISNYVYGWGWAYSPGWSLAVEEHFYFGFTFLLWLTLRKTKGLVSQRENSPFKHLETVVFLIMAVCLLLRVLRNIYVPEQYARNFAMTHLRIDSLLTGVLIAYLFYFKHAWLTRLYNRLGKFILLIAVICLSWTPIIEPLSSFFVKTIGFTLLYISFGSVLLYFLMQKNINTALDKIFTRPLVNFVGRIGFCSYAIYIIHLLMIRVSVYLLGRLNLPGDGFLLLILVFALSIGSGMIMTSYIERYFLKLRDKFYPSRV